MGEFSKNILRKVVYSTQRKNNFQLFKKKKSFYRKHHTSSIRQQEPNSAQGYCVSWDLCRTMFLKFIYAVLCVLFFVFFAFFPLLQLRQFHGMQDNSNMTPDCWTILVLLTIIQLQDVMTYNKCKCWIVYSINFFHQIEFHAGQETEVYCSFNWLILGESHKIEDNTCSWTIHETI